MRLGAAWLLGARLLQAGAGGGFVAGWAAAAAALPTAAQRPPLTLLLLSPRTPLTAHTLPCTAGMNPMDLRRGINLAVEHVVATLKSRAKMISTTEEIAQVGVVGLGGWVVAALGGLRLGLDSLRDGAGGLGRGG